MINYTYTDLLGILRDLMPLLADAKTSKFERDLLTGLCRIMRSGKFVTVTPAQMSVLVGLHVKYTLKQWSDDLSTDVEGAPTGFDLLKVIAAGAPPPAKKNGGGTMVSAQRADEPGSE